MTKMDEYRNRTKKDLKEEVANYEAQYAEMQGKVGQLFQLLLGLTGRLLSLEKKVMSLFPVAKASDWRSLAVVKLLDEQSRVPGSVGLVTEEMVSKMAEKLQMDYFEKENVEDDRIRGLKPCDEEPATKGHHAIVMIDLFKNGQVIPEERVVRSKIELGAHELFPELDAAITGMKVGEKKQFPLNIQGRTDSAEVSLLALRKSEKPKEEPKNEPQHH